MSNNTKTTAATHTSNTNTNTIYSVTGLVKSILSAAKRLEKGEGNSQYAHLIKITEERREFLKVRAPKAWERGMAILRALLDDRWAVTAQDQYMASVMLFDRGTSSHEEQTFLHVVNGYVSPEEVMEIQNISGEICVSEVEDNHLKTHKGAFLGLLFHGQPVKLYGQDVWSEVDMIGRRLCGDHWGSDRIEAWLVPARCRFLGVVTDSKKVEKEYTSLGATVHFFSSREVLKKRKEEKTPSVMELFPHKQVGWNKTEGGGWDQFPVYESALGKDAFRRGLFGPDWVEGLPSRREGCLWLSRRQRSSW